MQQRVGVRFETSDGRSVFLPPDSLIGRMGSAALRIDDPRISEAHALISLRGDGISLLGLRGRLSVGGKPASDVPLAPGVRVVLAGFFALTVVSVRLPTELPTVRAVDRDVVAVPALGVVAFFPGDDAPLRFGFDPDAAAHLWLGEPGPVLRVAGVDAPVAIGEPFMVAGEAFVLELDQVDDLAAHVTSDRGRFDTALHIVLAYDVVQITNSFDHACTLDGLQARTICELYAVGQPVHWREIARLVWPDADEADPAQLRARWDQLLSRLRGKLRDAGLRGDLVRTSRPGLVELVIGPKDSLVDAT